MKIVKKVTLEEATRYKELPSICRPKGLVYDHVGTLSYNYVHGAPATSFQQVHNAADEFLWRGPDYFLEMNRLSYMDYVQQKAAEIFDMALNKYISKALQFIATDELTGVSNYHGDLTLPNVIVGADSSVTFIDPGFHRGLPCKELDEAKLLQSAEGFCSLYRGTPPGIDSHVLPRTRIHIVLLMTHYIRLLHHVRHREARSFAFRRVNNIAAMWR